MTLGSVITETILIADPHAGHKSGSTSKMRLSCRAQLAREGEALGPVQAVQFQRGSSFGEGQVSASRGLSRTPTRGRMPQAQERSEEL